MCKVRMAHRVACSPSRPLRASSIAAFYHTVTDPRGGGGLSNFKEGRSTAMYKGATTTYVRASGLGVWVYSEDFDVEGGSRAVPSVCVNPRSSDQRLPCADAVCLHAPQYSFPRTGPALPLARDLRSRGGRICGVN